MNEKLKPLKEGAEMFLEDQKLLYTVIYGGLKRAVDTLRRPEPPTAIYELDPISSPEREEDIDTVYPAAA